MEYGIFVQSIRNVSVRVAAWYRESLLAKVFGAVGGALKTAVVNSACWRALARPERSNAAFEASWIRKGLDALFGAPVALVAAASRRMPESLTGRLVRPLLPAYASLLGLFVLIQTVVPHAYWRNAYALVLVVLLALAYVVKCALLPNEYRFETGKLDVAFLFFALAMVVGSLTSIVVADSVRVLIYNLVPMFFAFLFVSAVKTRREMTAVVRWLMAGVAVASVYGIYQYVNHVPVDPALVDVSVSGSVSRIFSTMGNPNNYAQYLVLCLPFFAAAFLNARSPLAKIVIAGASLLPLSNLVLTSSRSAWIAFAFSMLVFLFLKKRKVLPLLLGAALLAYPFLPASITDRLATIGRDSSSKYRIDIWETSARMLKDYWITGIGPGPEAFIKVFGFYNTKMSPPHSHMLPLQIWLEFGLAGIASFAWMIARFVKKGMDNVFKRRDAYFDNIAAAGIASLSGILACGLFEYVWFYPRVMSMFWIVIALMMAAFRATAHIRGAGEG